ncbi:MAG: hypothetical protein R6X09_01705 [Bacteroidales bacterium]
MLKSGSLTPLIAILWLLLLLSSFLACHSQQDTLNINITDEVISTGYLGNGVQWDAYPEAELWGASVSDADWQKLFQRLDFMRPGYVRCLINSPFRYYNTQTGTYDKTRNIESLKKLLQYCQNNNITVIFGEYNPPAWNMKQDSAWIGMAVDYLNYLVNDLGFTCIRYYTLFNEPDGNWSSTNGDYELWKKMVFMFSDKMKQYPGLTKKVSFAAPDIVVGYRNSESPYEPHEWIGQSAKDMDTLIGVYDVHAYPGQHEVHSGKFSQEIAKYVTGVPKDKKIILGEAGYKYYKNEDSALMKEHLKRVNGHPNTKGSDCNMMVYDFFYGLDMPLLCMDMMNARISGMAVWMLDDAMHSSGDAGDKTNIKIWGMWNILGEEVFGNPEEEEIRPWFYTWSLMCRYFPRGSAILKIKQPDNESIRMAAGIHNGKLTVAIVNTGNTDHLLKITLPKAMHQASLYAYQPDYTPKDSLGFPVPAQTGLRIKTHYKCIAKAQSFLIITEINE